MNSGNAARSIHPDKENMYLHFFGVVVVAVMKTEVAIVVATCVQLVALKSLFPYMEKTIALGAVAPLFTRNSSCEHTTVLLTNRQEKGEVVQAPRGVAILHVEGDYDNTTEPHLMVTIDKVHKIGQMWHCLVLVVVSDDPTFLTAFAHLSLRRHALRWSTRILVLTRLLLSQLGGLHGLLSNRNAMLLRAQSDMKPTRRAVVYMWQPYSAPTSKPVRVATWTSQGTLTLTSHMSLFPDKFFVFSSAPTLTVAIEVLPHNRISWVEDSDAPGGRRLHYTGYVNNIVNYFARAMNFTYRYVLSPERSFGTKLSDGSWTGMMGMVVREEVDFAPGPFIISLMRRQAADHTTVFYNGNVRILSGLTGLEVDPWGFLLPLTPMVWVATLTALLGLPTILQLISSCLSHKTPGRRIWTGNTFRSVRIILQQGIALPVEWLWWERLVLGLWMLMTLVLTKSYAGNLMSLLAVRYVPQPFQTLRDVLDHPSIAMIWQKYSRYEQYIREAKSGVYHEVAQMEEKARLKFHTQTQIKESLNTLVRSRDYVVIDPDMNLRSRIALDFSQRGQCDFYISRDGFLPYSVVMMSQKTNPLIYGFDKSFLTIVEQGLTSYWIHNVPNISECENVPKKMLLTSSISISNIWGQFVVLAGGLATGILALYVELLLSFLP